MNAPHTATRKPSESMVAYYQDLHFNPVLIQVENPEVWQSHFDKRRNLYERHLGVPLAYLRGARIVEFGPNSGENALLPALFGAKLTLVEPNTQVLPRLKGLFNRFGVAGQIESLQSVGIDEFNTTQPYDLVIAEGFLFTLPNRDTLLRKLTTLIRPGCLGVISYNDLVGGLLEYLRRAILFRACELAGVADVQSDACREIARRLYADDCARINMSRTFEVWWRDTLVNPFCMGAHTWSLPDLLPILHEQGCEFHSTSPLWFNAHQHNWYKNVRSTETARQNVLTSWQQNLPYFLTGIAPSGHVQPSVNEGTVDDVIRLVKQLADWNVNVNRQQVNIEYPTSLDRLLNGSTDERLRNANAEWKHLITALNGSDWEQLVRTYEASSLTRTLWGTAYHYLSFQRSLVASNVATAAA